MIKLRIFSLLCILMFGCVSIRDYSSSNMSSLYRINEKNFHPEFSVFNVTDSTMHVYVKLLPAEFLFARQEDGSFRSFIEIRSEVIPSFEEVRVIDSATQSFSFDLTEKEEIKVVDLIVPAPGDTNIVIRITIRDATKGNDDFFLVPVNRQSNPSRQDFNVSDQNGNILFRNNFTAIDTLSVVFNIDTVQRFSCKYYNREFRLAPPPYNFDSHDDFNYKPDSFWFATKEELQKFTLLKQGFYHIQTDSSGKDGLTLYRFTQGFPDITSPQQMIESVRYLVSKKEYEEMKAGNPKSMIDNFWLTHGGNEEKTRSLIKKYYTRVREANKFFTSHTEGWRTDRGMLYIIFGSPGTVYKSNESESWTYGTPNSSLALNFFFIKVNNPFTENDFTLSRSPTYESSWFRAVEVWRQGRPYNSFY